MLETILVGVIGTGGILGIGFALLRRAIDKKFDKAMARREEKEQERLEYSKVNREIQASVGRVLFWVNKHLTSDYKLNGEYKDAWSALQAAEKKLDELDANVLAKRGR